MASRNLTLKYENFRSRYFKHHHSQQLGGLPDDASSHLISERDHSVSVGIPHTLPPEWVDIVESIQKNISDIKVQVRQLQKLHAARLKVQFAGEQESKQEREIEIITQETSRVFHQAENSLKRIATIGNPGGSALPAEERIVRLNVMRALATDIQGLSKEFRHSQKDFIIKLKGQDEAGSSYFATTENDTKLTLTDVLDRDMTPENIRRLDLINRDSSERDKELMRLVQSVADLAQLFRELNVLVIEQGSVLDRIDYQIERTLSSVQQGNEQLTVAEKSSRHARSLICILLLIITIGILIAILWYKHS